MLVVALALVPGPGGMALAADLPELRARAERAASLARDGARAPSPRAMDRVRDTLGLPDTVVVAGRRVTLPSDPFLAALRGQSAGDFRAAASHLDAFATALGEAASASSPDLADVRHDVDRAYAAIADPTPSLVERVLRSVRSALSELLRRMIDGVGGPVGILLLVVLAALIAVALRALGIRMVPSATAPAAGRPTAADWRQRAEEAAASGDLAAAVAAAFRAVIAAMAERGYVEDRPSITAGEIRVRVGADVPAVVDATRRYERVRYGGRPASDEDLRSLLDVERRIRRR